MKFEISTSASPFSFSCHPRSLDTAISKLTAVLSASPAGDRTYCLHSDGKCLYAIGISSTADTFAATKVDTFEVSKSGSLCFDPVLLQGITKGRADMTFSHKEGNFNCKLMKGNYEVNLVTLPVTKDCASLVNEKLGATAKGSIPINADVLAMINEGVSRTAIKDVYESIGSILTYIMFSAKATVIFSFDNHHVSYFKSKVTPGVDRKLALASSSFAILAKMFGEDSKKASLTVTDTKLRFSGVSFCVELPIVQVNEQDFDLITDYVKGVTKPSYSCEFSPDDLTAVISNLLTIHADNSKVSLYSKKKDVLNVSFQSQSGSASDTIAVKCTAGKTFECRLDPRILNDSFSLLGSLNGDPVLSVIDDRCLTVSGKLKSGATFLSINSLSE